MKRCRQYENIMQNILDGSASGRDRETFERHLLQCKTCRNAYRKMVFSLELLTAAPAPAPGPEFTARTVQKAIEAGKIRIPGRIGVASWCFAGLLVLFTLLLAAGWSSVAGPVARLGLRGLLGVFLEAIVLCRVFDKLQAVLAEVVSIMGDAVVAVALGPGVPVFWGCLLVLCLVLFVFIRSGFRIPDIQIKGR